MTEPSELSVTNTVLEDEYREAIDKHGEDEAFEVLEQLYKAEKRRRE